MKNIHTQRTGKIQKSSSILAALILLLSSCMPDALEVDNIPAIKTDIVVSSQILSDTSIVVMLTKTIGALEASEKSDPQGLIAEIGITDAEVRLISKGIEYKFEHRQDGVYEGVDIPLEAGTECELFVTSKTFGSVSAKTIVQPPIYFDSVRANSYFNGFFDNYAQVNYSLLDPPAQNFYLINVQGAKRKELIENVINPGAYTHLLEDKIFNGREFSEELRVTTQNFYEGDSIAVSLANVSKDYFNYLKVRSNNRLGLVEVFSEPINYPTNIVGGRGFFTLHLPDVRIIVL